MHEFVVTLDHFKADPPPKKKIKIYIYIYMAQSTT